LFVLLINPLLEAVFCFVDVAVFSLLDIFHCLLVLL
jgi:hypothetical protein